MMASQLEPGLVGRAVPTLKGQADEPSEPKDMSTGWHPVDWACEFAGTAFQLFLGFGAVTLFESSRSPLRSALPGGVRLVIIGTCFGLLGAAVAVSPLGRRSGAHLNPAVTFGFFLRRHTSLADLGGFAAAQTGGALVAAAAFVATWRGWAKTVGDARTQPQDGLGGWAVTGIEAALTCGLILTVFVMLSSVRTARWTPVAVTCVVPFLIWAGAPYTGASLNPSRTVGPDLVTTFFPSLGSYLLGPLLGAVAAAALFAVGARERRTLTAKLFHDPAYPSVHASQLAVAVQSPSVVQ